MLPDTHVAVRLPLLEQRLARLYMMFALGEPVIVPLAVLALGAVVLAVFAFIKARREKRGVVVPVISWISIALGCYLTYVFWTAEWTLRVLYGFLPILLGIISLWKVKTKRAGGAEKSKAPTP